jgi:hypothetical protein
MSTDKPPPLRGYRESQETSKETSPVDPKRFKEELSKVTESDEAQQRKKRNSKRSEEETDEDLVQPKTPIAASGDLFSLFMSETESSSMMKPQTPQNIRSTPAPSTSSEFTIQEDSPTAPSAPPTAQQMPPALGQGMPVPTPRLSSPAQNFNTQSNSFTPEESPVMNVPEGVITTDTPSFNNFSSESSSTDSSPTNSSPTNSSPTNSSPTEHPPSTYPQSPQRVAKKTTKDTSLLAKKAPSAAHAAKQKKEVAPAEIKLTAAKPASIPPAPKQEPPIQKASSPPVSQQKPLLQTAVAPPSKTPASPAQAPLKGPALPVGQKHQIDLNKEIRPTRVPSDRQAAVQEVVPQGTKTHSDTSREKSKDRDEKKESELSAPAPTAPIVPFTPTPIAPTPAYASLPPQVYELFEKMMGLMTIEQNSGVTTTTVTVSMKDSVFNGAQIILDHYSTAPNAFNVTIAGSPQAQELISANMVSLVASFEQSKLAFQINLRSPILLEEHQVTKRKKRARDEEHQEGKRQKK